MKRFLVLVFWLPLLAHAQTDYTRTGSGPGSYTYTVFDDTNGAGTCENGAYQASLVAVSGDVIQLPAATVAWTSGNTVALATSGVTLKGAGQGVTILNCTTGIANNYYFTIGSAATVGYFTMNAGPAGCNPGGFSVNGTTDGWRITHITFNQTYNGATGDNYFVIDSNGGGGTYGLIDNCTLIGGAGDDELIFTKGHPSAWQEANNFGSGSAVYIENCAFSGSGYVSDFNSSSRAVVRFCTINGNIKIDAHGMFSAFPARGPRQVEVYGNTWTGNYVQEAVEMRGGTGLIFNNASNGGGGGALSLCDYAANANEGNYTPAEYAIPDQIGSGEDQVGTLTFTVGTGNPATVTTSGPLNIPIGTEFHMSTYGSGAEDPGGTTTITSNSTPALTTTNCNDCTVTGTNTFTVPVNVTVAGTGSMTWGWYSRGGQASPVYGWGNQTGTIGSLSNWPLMAWGWGITYTDWIAANRDYYDYNASFVGTDGNGVGVGLKASMPSDASMAAVTKPVAYWATDEGNWNQSGSGGQGDLYIWHYATQKWGTGSTSGATPDYAPYQYPFYSSGPPVVTPATTYATVGVAFSYQIIASNSPTSYAATGGMPGWGSLDTSTGIISGTPSNTTGQPFSVTVNATNGSGTSTPDATITIDVGNAPVVSSSATVSVTVNQALSYTITASNSPTSYGATSLPGWASVNTSTGAITGTPTVTTGSPLSSTVSAINNFGTGSKGLTITVNPASTINVTGNFMSGH